jgi:hypothetical protein
LAGFLRNILSRLPSALRGPRAPTAILGAFGKHPGWNDHIDPDIGLEGRLVEFKQLLYLDGIRDRAIQRWHAADPSQLIAFGHVFAWETNDDVIVGRLWHSRDGRGRDDFPMVLCAQCVGGIPLAWALANALPVLERVEASLRRTTDRQAAIEAVEHGRADLSALAARATVEPVPAASGQALARLADAPDVGETGLIRIMHVLRDSDFGQEQPTHAEQVRVPRCAASPVEGIQLWSQAIEGGLGHAPSVVYLAPTAQPWIDLLIGQPDPAQFLAVRSSLKLLPLTTDIAYTIDDDFTSRKRALFAQARAAAPKAATTAAAAAGV